MNMKSFMKSARSGILGLVIGTILVMACYVAREKPKEFAPQEIATETVVNESVNRNKETRAGVSLVLEKLIKTDAPVLKENVIPLVSSPNVEDYIMPVNIIEEKIVREPVQMELAYVYADALNLRTNYNTDSDVVRVLGFGQTVEIHEYINFYLGDDIQNQWAHVITEDGKYEGYINTDYIVYEPPYISLGRFDITYYCPCPKCCVIETGITASGERAVEGVTIAADPSIPFGTELVINGHTYIVQDRGGKIKGNHIDVFMNSHDEALRQKLRAAEVFMKVDIE